ncbi:MAG: hypothetical protein ABL930_12345 [Pseudobdellovibrio sp.]
MKYIFQLLLGATVMSGCTTFNKPSFQSSVPVPPIETQNIYSRNVASGYVDSAYNTYFADGNTYHRIAKVEAIAKQLHSVMPDKGHPKKKLVQQFLSDVRREALFLSALPGSADDIANSWVPSAQLAQFKEKIMSLGRVAQSYKIMSRAGIILTASGVFETDSNSQDFYLSLLDRATYEIENTLRDLMLVYLPEIKDAQDNDAKINYSKGLANDIRNNLRKVLQPKSLEYKKVDAVLNKISKSNAIQAKKLIKTSEFLSAKSLLQNSERTISGDIEGFDDEVDTVISTRLNIVLINELISSTR